jgi:hypothetical protein
MPRNLELWGFCGDAAAQEAVALEGTVSFPRSPDTSHEVSGKPIIALAVRLDI